MKALTSNNMNDISKSLNEIITDAFYAALVAISSVAFIAIAFNF